MSVTVIVPASQLNRVHMSVADPGRPNGFWYHGADLTGDATGGTVQATFNFDTEFLYSLEHAGLFSAAAAPLGAVYEWHPGWPIGKNGHLWAWSGHMAGSGAPATSGSASSLDAMNPWRIPVMVPHKRPGTPPIMRISLEANTDLRDYQFRIWGWFWESRDRYVTGVSIERPN